MKEKIQLAVIPLVRNTYEVEEGMRRYHELQAHLMKIPQVEWHFWTSPVEMLEEAQTAFSTLDTHALDGLVLFSATFHLGDMGMWIAQRFSKPILVWAIPESPYTGSKVRLNSLVGAHLDCSNLYKAGYSHFDFLYGDTSVSSWEGDLNRWIDQQRIHRKLAQSKIALIGSHANTFFNLDVYEPSLMKDTGCMMQTHPLEDLLSAMPEKTQLEDHRSLLKETFQWGEGMDTDRSDKVAGLCGALEQFARQHSYDGIALRCWPEFARTCGISPCASMSCVMPRGIPIACEGDIEGLLSMLALKAVGCDALSLSDLSQIIEEESAILMWHCGVAPYDTWDGQSAKTLDTYFAGGKGVTAGFVMKPGPVTMIRMDYARGHWRLFALQGEAIPTKKELKGTYVRVKVDRPLEQMRKMLMQGVAHHVVLAYGDYEQLFRDFAKSKGWEIL